MQDIVAFIQERLGDAESVAYRAAGAAHGAAWFDQEGVVGVRRREGSVGQLCRFSTRWTAVHIALYDPAAVLRDVEATRRIVNSCRYVINEVRDSEDDGECSHEWVITDHTYTLKCLASRWSDHEDYRPEWAVA